MDGTTSLSPNYDPQSVSIVKFAGHMPPLDAFQTQITISPGGNCFEDYALSGDFFLSGTLYQKSKRVGTIHSVHCNQDGNFEIDLTDIQAFTDPLEPSVMVVDYYHSHQVPVELYITHIHRETQSYFNYPMLNFMGDLIYPRVHDTQMENTVFWPGAVNDQNNQLSLLVVNPFKLPYQYQLSLFKPDREVVHSPPMRVKPFSSNEHFIEDVFQGLGSEIKALDGTYAVCVSAQYKLIAYAVHRAREKNIITMVDHLHNYCLY